MDKFNIDELAEMSYLNLFWVGNTIEPSSDVDEVELTEDVEHSYVDLQSDRVFCLAVSRDDVLRLGVKINNGTCIVKKSDFDSLEKTGRFLLEKERKDFSKRLYTINKG